jgi:hypothetical protein
LYNQAKATQIKTEEQLKSLKHSNTKFETDYSLVVSHVETLKKALSDSKLDVGRRSHQLSSLRETVRKFIELINLTDTIQQVSVLYKRSFLSLQERIKKQKS